MRDHLQVWLNDRPHRVDGADAARTVLAWLREQQRLTGSKEGCGEGDCGACTIVVARASAAGVVRWDAVNACIAFMPHLDRALVTTVEGIAGPGGELHPCQQAMVDLHGSQCGFCTPGFVAALYALYRAHIDGGTRPDRAVVDRWLAGNLCRCTGYGPIAAAAVRMLELPRPAWDIARAEQERAALARLAAPDDVVVHTPEGRMSIPAGLRSLTAMAAAAPDATVVAGATDVGLWVTKKLLPLPTRVFTHAVFDDGFRAIHRHGRRVILGAGVTHAEAMAAELHPALTELWRRFAGEQVRNAGTVGGNLANGSPIGDLAPALIALDATLHLRHCDDTRELPLEAFFLAYGRQDRRAGEIVTAVSFDLPAEGAVFDVHKVSKRFDDDISAVCGAFHLPLVDGRVVAPRIAYGGMAAIPKRARHVEAALDGQRFDAASIIAALPAYSRDFQPIDDMRASAAYRLLVAGNLLRRILWEHEGTPVRLVGPRADVAEYAS